MAVFQGSYGEVVENETGKQVQRQIMESLDWFAKETEISLIGNRKLWM